MHWVENGIRWFPLFNDDDDDLGDRNKRQSDDEEINVRILLVDVKLLNISNGTMSASTSEQTIDETIDGLVNAVMNGSLSTIPLNINNTEVTTTLSLVNQCMDVNCNSTSNVTELVTSPTEPATSPSESSTTPTDPSKTPGNGAVQVEKQLCIYVVWLFVLALLLH